MRKLLTIIAISLALASCNKEALDTPENNAEQYRADFTFGVAGQQTVETKGEVIGTGNDDFIERLDLFDYIKKTGELVKHKTWYDPNGIDLSSISYSSYGAYNETHTYLVLANFDQTTIDFYLTLDGKQIGDNTIAILPLNQGLFRLHVPMMGAVGYCSFQKNQANEFTLNRYVTRLDIEKITADFDDASYFNKDVVLKRIALTGVTNVIRPLHYSMTDIGGFNEQPIYGVGVGWSSVPAFGGITKGHFDFNDISESTWINFETTFNPGEYGGQGYLNADYPYVLCNNKKLGPGVLNIDVTGDMLTASCQVIPDGQGILASSTDPSVTHSLDLNTQFYLINLDRSSWANLYGKWDSQDNCQKIVLEVEIDGVTNFYIIDGKRFCPNTIYRVHNITIKGPGSEYSNKYVQKTVTKATGLRTNNNGNVEIGNIVIGAPDDENEESL